MFLGCFSNQVSSLNTTTRETRSKDVNIINGSFEWDFFFKLKTQTLVKNWFLNKFYK